MTRASFRSSLQPDSRVKSMRILLSAVARHFGYVRSGRFGLGYDPLQGAGVAALYTLFSLIILVEVFGAPPWLLGTNAFIIAGVVEGFVYLLVWTHQRSEPHSR